MKPNFIAIMVLLLAAASHAAEPVEYTKQVLPVLEKHCVECHGPKKQESSLRVDSRAALIKGIWIR